MEFARRLLGDEVPRPLRRLNAGVPGHEGHAARVAAEIHGRQVGVAGDDRDVERIEPQDFRGQHCEDRVRPLADLGRPTEHGNAAAPVALELDARVGHWVPVDGEARPCDVGRTRQADALPRGKLPKLLLPAGAVDHFTDALPQAHRADLEPVRGERVGRDEMLEAQLRRIHGQLLGDLVELHLEREPRLWGAMAALGSAGRFVGECSCALKLVPWHVIRHRLQRARVVRAGDAVGAIPAAVQERLEVHRRDRAVLFHAGFHPHERRMASAVAIKDLLAGERDLHGPPGEHREFRHDDLVAERVALAPEAAAVGRGDDTNLGGGELEHLSERAVHVVRRLGRAPQSELAVGEGRPVGHRRVLLHRQMRAALEEQEIFAYQIGGREPLVHVAELEVDELVEVAAVAVVVDARLRVRNGMLGVRDGRQRLVRHVDQLERGGRDVLAHRGHARHGVTHEPHLVDRQGVLVLAHRQDAERDRQVPSGQHGFHARERPGFRWVDAGDPGVGMGTAEQFGVQHARKEQVVGEPRGTGDLGRRVDLADRFADDSKRCTGPPDRRRFFDRRLFTGAHTWSRGPARPAPPACEPQPIPRPRRSSGIPCSGTGCPTAPA